MFNDISRRHLLKTSAALSLSGWLDVLAARAAPLRGKHRSCIVLWMDGGPSQKDTFDMKPGTPDAGEFQPIQSSVPGIQISEHLPRIAKWMHEAAIVRSMSTGEGAHERAKYNMHTGYRQGEGGLLHPTLGSLVSAVLGKGDVAMPNFVAVGRANYGAGFLGAKHQPLVVTDPKRGIEHLKPLVEPPQFERRMGLLEEMEGSFRRDYQAGLSGEHHTTYQRARTLLHSKEVKAFDLSQEKPNWRERYGKGFFAECCLLARRLVEVGVPFVEVTLGGWDSHSDNFGRHKLLSQQLDGPVAALLGDLRDRGLLSSTLVVWMGEFGRSPKITPGATKPGRDHWPKAWSTVLFGGGIKTGQIIGETDRKGAAVTKRPVPITDFLATICTILGIDYTKNNHTANARPVRIVDKGAKPIAELVS